MKHKPANSDIGATVLRDTRYSTPLRAGLSIYRPLLYGMQLTCAAWEECLNTPYGVGWKNIQILLKTWPFHLSDLRTAVTTNKQYWQQLYNRTRTKRNCTYFLTGIHPLLVTDKRRSAFPSANNCQFHTPQLPLQRTVSWNQQQTTVRIHVISKCWQSASSRSSSRLSPTDNRSPVVLA